jgi:hypothetical protein
MKMNKNQMLDAIEHAKKIHLEEMHKISSVLKGNEVENPTPLGKMECECGTWFYSNEKEMKEILGAQLFERLDKQHENWHKEYHNIYNIFFKEEKKTGFFAKILKHNKVDSLTLDKAKLYFSDLQKITDELLKASESATRRVSALKDSKFH